MEKVSAIEAGNIPTSVEETTRTKAVERKTPRSEAFKGEYGYVYIRNCVSTEIPFGDVFPGIADIHDSGDNHHRKRLF